MRWWSWMGLGAVLLFDVWLRCHTVGPTVRDRLGVDLYPVTGASAEPLDCDEAVYAYIGQRLSRGAVMYRDASENKPPLGYWLYAVAVGLFEATELTVRLMPIPFVLATIAVVWRLAARLRGPGAAILAASIYAVVSTDPFLFGNGANMEHMINLFASASLALVVSASGAHRRARLFAAGVSLGLAALVKQVAIVHGVVYAGSLLLRRGETGGEDQVRTERARLVELLALGSGVLLVCAVAAAVLIAQGAGPSAYEDIFRYGPALATDTPPPANAPPKWVRWATGNADPEGALPWPFGRTNYLVWWGSGSWPVWLSGLIALPWLAFGPGANGPRRLVGAWTISACVQVALPGLFWQHYYLLPLPGLAVAVAVFVTDQIERVHSTRGRRRLASVLATGVIAALLWTARIQWVEYLQVAPEELTIRDKGGRQWVTLRALGRALARRSVLWEKPRLFVWGWQSPLYFYSRLDPASRQLFADDLIKNFAGTDHPLIRPRTERIMKELRANPPALVFNGYPPFPALRQFLEERYVPSRLTPVSPDGRGLWVERSRYGEFETFENR